MIDDRETTPFGARTEKRVVVSAPAQQPIALRRLGILVIDDDRLTRRAILEWLRNHGFEAWGAEDRNAAVHLYQKHVAQIDLVLSDVRMPGLDALRTLDALRICNPAVRCCFMTCSTNVSTQVELVQRGALHILIKPVVLHIDTAIALRDLAMRPALAGHARRADKAEASVPDGTSCGRESRGMIGRVVRRWLAQQE